MTNPVRFLIQGKNIILVVEGKSYTVSKDTHIAYPKIIEALKAEDWDTVRNLVEPKKVIIDFGKGNITIDNNQIFWKGEVFHNALASRMIEMYTEGFPIEPMVLFMEHLMENPSMRSVEQVYGFLEKNKLPITEDGYFLAFKRVRPDYKDIHSGKNDNNIGQVVVMDRNRVNDDPDQVCSAGLHFASEHYVNSGPFSFKKTDNPLMILKINPRDVVSIPTDYNGSKGRCCRYEVVGEVDGTTAEAFTKVVNGDYSAPVAPSAAVIDPWPFPVATLYDCRRVFGGRIEYSELTLDEARHNVQKNITQKKAQLEIVEHGTNKVIS